MNPLVALPETSICRSPVIVALDFADAAQTLSFVRQLDPSLCRVKIGKELFTACGPSLVEALITQGFQLFLDLKYHDIPNTVASACRIAADLGVWMVNVHASGGRRMMEAACDAVANSQQRPLLTAVTVLTSMSHTDLAEIGLPPDTDAQVLRLATLARDSGLDGVVCSAHEASLLKPALGHEFILVTPGIRLTDNLADDQTRVMTPIAARAAGADYLVIGRPITRVTDPLAVLERINAELNLS